MSFFFTIFKKLINRPSFKFKLNLFFLKESLSLSFKHLIYIHIFINIQSKLKIKLFKTVNFLSINLAYYYVLIINLILVSLFCLLNVKKKL